ncbi:hypothetical protein Zm00014a_001908 [Zea mays]|jgi:hypothetical protein|uniref:Uncharacterized protein n=1 Tax=Zea mays TaxID=4577 RepID=A0A3L6FN07_MAIZE|nr:hypothetical protein Zm00014a_001908 [Zea mays]
MDGCDFAPGNNILKSYFTNSILPKENKLILFWGNGNLPWKNRVAKLALTN